jgi:hypothetical protein
MNKFMLFVRMAATFPILVLAAAICMLLVAGFDEGFKPCPSYRRLEATCATASRRTCIAFVKYENFCGQTMHPRATKCCRVPCLQNYTTYFDSNGNSADCYTQEFVAMSLSIAGFILLGISLFWMLCTWAMIKLFPQYCNFNYIVRGIDCRASGIDSVGSKSTPVAIDDQVQPEWPPECSGSANVEQVQIV